MRGVGMAVVAIGMSVFCGCAETELQKRSRMALQVATGPKIPSESCESIESLTVKITAGVQAGPPQRAMEEAVTSARYEAAKMGGNFVRLDPLRAWTETDAQAKWVVVEANGTAYHCPDLPLP